jgi:beta-glucosidase
MNRYLNAILMIICISAAANAAVSGRVVDGTSKGVADAMVCYTNIANRLVYVYTDANGYFNIPAPTDWRLNDLPMYKPVPSTANHSIHPSNSAPSSFNAHVNGDMIVFNVSKGARKVSADLYDIAGKRIMRIFNTAVNGDNSYAFNPFMNNSKVLPPQIFVVRLSDGQSNISLRIINVGNAKTVKSFDEATVVEMQSSPSLAKIAAVDGIRAGKTGYFGKSVSINTYSETVPDIVIKDANIEARVDSLMQLLNNDANGLAIKMGQMMQPNYAGNAGVNPITNQFVGSYLKGEGNAAPMTAALSTKYKIPLIVGNDMVHGGRHVYFPHNIGLGCANDSLLTELAYRIFSMCCLPLYNNENFAPCLDVHRDYRSGRVYESFGESPDLVSHMARAAIRGIQGTDLTSGYTMMATLKHWAAAGAVDQGKTGNSGNCPNISAATNILSKIHFPPFIAAIKAGAAGVMTGYPGVHNTCMAINKEFTTDTLKTSWKFDGFVITDWATSAQREAQCAQAGNDLLMTIDPTEAANQLKTIDIARINDAVKRLLRVKFRMGLFENPWPNLGLNNYLASKDYRDVARACVRKSLVLLKNDTLNKTTNARVLPLSKTAKVHVVVGSVGDNMGYQCGGWSSTGATIPDNTNALNGADEGWQGTGVARAINGATTIWNGISTSCPTATKSADASGIPADAAVIVVVVGEPTYAEINGDVTDITLNNLSGGNFTGGAKPSDQIALVQACKTAAGTRPVVTILVTGRPNALGTIPTNSNALVAAWLPGTEGNGVSDVLFSENSVDFVGKLSFTWPASNAQNPIHAGNLGDATGSGGTPLFPFGWGLTYQ